MTKKLLYLAISASFLLLYSRCRQSPPPKAGVVAHILTEPIQLTPFNQNDNISRNINTYIFQTLTTIDHQTGDYAPYLVLEMPKLVALPGGKLRMEMEIRPEATWDDGSPITAQDVEFSLKVIRTPQTNCPQTKPYFEKIEDLKIDPQNPKKFTLIYGQADAFADAALADLMILPQKIYDKDNLLKPYKLSEMTDMAKLKADATLAKFGEQYNSAGFQRETVVGSGAYKFERWETGKRVSLVRKPKWWADALREKPEYTKYAWAKAAPKQIIFELIADVQTATTVLKSGKLDVMSSIPPKIFIEDFDAAFKQKYALFQPTRAVYFYIAMHTRNPKLADSTTRQALAYLFDRNEFIKTAYQGLAVPAQTYVAPHLKKFIATDLNPYLFNIEKAKSLLAQGGWTDSNQNGILDKKINGQLTELALSFMIRSQAPIPEKAALLLQANAQKVGIKINIEVVDAALISERLKQHKYELALGGLGSPVESDPRQIWSTDAYNNGMNYTGFGNAETDKIIETLRGELDMTRRIALHHTLQRIINRQVPLIFVVNPKATVAISKAYGEVAASNIEPCYWLASLGSGIVATVE